MPSEGVGKSSGWVDMSSVGIDRPFEGVCRSSGRLGWPSVGIEGHLKGQVGHLER